MLRNETVFHYHYLRPENRWGVFKSGVFIRSFEKLEEAQAYCDVRNGIINTTGYMDKGGEAQSKILNPSI